MRPTRLLLAFLAGLLPAIAVAQTRPADAASLVGTYRLANYPDANQPKGLPGNPWPAKCQFFGIYKSGWWLHQETPSGKCINDVPAVLPDTLRFVRWNLVRDGVITVGRKDGIGGSQMWKVEVVVAETRSGAPGLAPGDLVMHLMGADGRVAWTRYLHRVHSA